MIRPTLAQAAAGLVALSVVPIVATLSPPADPPPACVRPADFGAVPDNGMDDRVQLQAAIDAAVAGPGCLELGPGRYDVTRRPEAGASGIPSLVIRGPLRVSGPATLAMLGSAVRPGETAPADWVLLEVKASDVTISGIAFEGDDRTASEEQTHLLQVRGPAERVTIERSSFLLPGPAAAPDPPSVLFEDGWLTYTCDHDVDGDGDLDCVSLEKHEHDRLQYASNPGARGEAGDCIRLLGTVAERVRDVTIRDVRAPVCWRSFLGLQRGVHGVLVERVETTWVGDQVIDSEPTGGAAFGCSPIISDVTVRHSVLRRGVPRGIAITIAGRGCAIMDDVLIEDTVIPDGGIDILDVGTVTLRGLHLDSAPADNAQPTILARRRIGALVIEDSVIRRAAHASQHPVIQISALSGVAPTWAWLDGVTVEQNDARAAVRVEGLASLTIRRSILRYTGWPTGDWAVSGWAGSVVMADSELLGAWRGPTAVKEATLLGVRQGAVVWNPSLGGSP